MICIIIAIAFISLMNITPSLSKAEAGKQEVSAYLDDMIPELMSLFDIPGVSVALIKDGEVIWSEGYGYQDLEEDKPVNSDTLFRAESITKSVTAWGVMNLVEQGYIELDDPLDKHLTSWQLPETEYAEEAVTIRQLLSHSSGITGGTDYELPGTERPPLEEVLAGEHSLHQAKLVREPGSSFEYSNQGFIILELLVEDVTGKNYDDYIESLILDPLTMSNTTYNHGEEVQSRLATSYYLDGEPVPRHVYPFKTPGGLNSTAADLARFYAAGMDTEGQEKGRGILTAESVKVLYNPVIEPADFYAYGSDGVGLGYFIDYLKTGEKAVFHGGEGAGSLGMAYAVPESGEGIVVLTNSKGSWPFLFTVLGEWAETSGFSQPEMSRLYSNLQRGAWAGIIALIAISVYIIGSLVFGLKAGKIKLAPLSAQARVFRIFKIGVSGLLLGVWWLAGEMVIRNLLPLIQSRLTIALLVLVLAIVISSLFVKPAAPFSRIKTIE